jgi:CheY-like chemotaxis protein
MIINSKILVVEDDSDFRKLIRLSINNGVRQILEAKTALDALYAAKEFLPDILFLDIGLAGHFDGFSLCEALAKDQCHRNLKVVVVSGSSAPEDIARAERLGAVTYIVKPVSPSTLKSLVEQLESPAEIV